MFSEYIIMGQWTNSNKARMGSNVYTDVNQGGGNKKAGFPYQVGRNWHSSLILGIANVTRCQTLTCMQFTLNPNVRQSRGIGHKVDIPYFSM